MTEDGSEHTVPERWDMIIAFPPCTHLAVSGAKHFEKKREDGRQRDGIEFFCKFFEADCDKIVIENPVGIISGEYIERWFPDICSKYSLPRKFSQKVHPYYFGDPFEKTTCLWLKGVPELIPTNIVPPRQDRWSEAENRCRFGTAIAEAIDLKTEVKPSRVLQMRWQTNGDNTRRIYDFKSQPHI